MTKNGQVATALSSALAQATSKGGTSRPEQIRMEIDPATLETREYTQAMPRLRL